MEEILDFDEASEFEILARGFLKHQGIAGFDYLNQRRFFLRHSGAALEGQKDSIITVAVFLALHGQAKNSELILDALAEQSDDVAKALLGALLLEAGELKKAHSLISECSNRNALGMYSLGLMYRKLKPEGADEFASYVLAYLNGFKLGMFATACLSLDKGELFEAETMFELSAKDGFIEAYAFLARIAWEAGDLAKEKAWLIQGASEGDAECAFGLASRHLELDEFDQAEALLREAAICGHVAAAGELALLLLKFTEDIFLMHNNLFSQSLDDPFDETLKLRILNLEKLESEFKLEAFYWAEYSSIKGYERAFKPYSRLLELNGNAEEAEIWQSKHSIAWEAYFMKEVFGDDQDDDEEDEED